MVAHKDKLNFLIGEAELHRNWYAGLVKSGKMTQDEADYKNGMWNTILGDYQRKKVHFVSAAGALSNNRHFWKFIEYLRHGESGPEVNEERAADFIRVNCGIVSRKDLRYNEEAQKKFRAIRQQYKDWRRFKDYHEPNS